MRKFLFLPVVVIPIFCVTCQKDVIESRAYPRIITLEVTNITSEGATFNAELLAMGTKHVVEYGFLWDTVPSLYYNRSERISSYGSRAVGAFSYRSEATLLKDQTYFVMSFVKTEDLTVYGTRVRFHSKGSLPPILKSLEPIIANWGDTLTLKGKRFSSRKNNVFFGDKEGAVVFQSDSLLKVIVPFEKNEARVKIIINTAGQEVFSTEDFTYKKPVIDDFSPKQGTFGDELTITGSDFISNGSLNVTFNGQEAKILDASLQKLIVQIPAEANQRELQLCVSANGQTGCSKYPFRVDPPVIGGFSQTEVTIGQSIVIEGQGFNPHPMNNVIHFGQLATSPHNASSNRLEVEIPDGIYDSRDVSMRINTAGQEHVHDSKIRLMDKWLRKGEISDGLFSSVVYSFSHGQYGFCAISSDNKIITYRYDPAVNKWFETGTFPGTFRSPMTAFVIGDYAYVGGFYGTQDFWKYDLLNNDWEQIADFPRLNEAMTSFVVDGRGFVLCKFDNEHNFWEYDVASNSWKQLNDFIPNEKWHAYADLSFSHGSKGYVLTGDGTTGIDELWEYAPLTGQWKRLADQMDNLFYPGRNVFVIRNEAYLMPGAYDQNLCKYDIATNRWSVVGSAVGRHNSICFTVGDAAYIGGGHNFSKSFKDFWEYNPNP